MRALFTCVPNYGHFNNLVPLARELANQGHPVAFATSAAFGPVVRALGFAHFPCGFDFDGGGVIFKSLKERGELEPDTPTGPVLFASVLAPKMLEDMPAVVDAWQPDIILREPTEFGGALIAEVRGLPHVNITWAQHFRRAGATALYGETLNQLRRSYGLPPDPELDFLNQYLAIDFMPPSWHSAEFPRPPVAHSFRLPPFDQSGTETLPDWVSSLPFEQTVYATIGTTFNQSPETFQIIIDSLRDEQVNLIITVGRTMDPLQFGSQPEHVKIERYIPQTLLFPYCDAVLFHGGYNTLLTAITHGLPVVVLPQAGADQLVNGQRSQAVGIGILIDGQPPEASQVRHAMRTVLADPTYRTQMHRLQQEIQALPDLSEAVDLLAQLL